MAEVDVPSGDANGGRPLMAVGSPADTRHATCIAQSSSLVAHVNGFSSRAQVRDPIVETVLIQVVHFAGGPGPVIDQRR